MKCVVSIDLGTQGVRMAAYDLEGRLIGLAYRDYKTYYPAPGMAKQDPEEWWDAVRSCMREIRTEYPSISVVAIAASATSSTVLAVDPKGNPLTRAIMWMDTRAALQAEKITKTSHPLLNWCGGIVSAEWFLPKLLWIKEKQPEVYSKAHLFVEALDWLNYKLTGKWVCSRCVASCKWNYLPGEGWPGDFLTAIGLPELPDKIPANVLSVGEVIGEVRKEVALDFNCGKNIQVVQGGN
ncbi:MAG: FGGY family carbohydrate kinase [Candidatus Methanomethylicaceae archaeon]